MLQKEIELFNEYVNDFDSLEENIIRKKEHSIRVMNHSIMIAKSLGLNEEDIYLAGLIGLLHDIGRFPQWQMFHTFNDLISVDHGVLGAEILKKNNYIKKYISDEESISIILAAIINHNKFKIDSSVKGKTVIFSQIIRDADKIDIMEYLGNSPLKDGGKCSHNVVVNLENEELLLNAKVNNEADLVIRMLCFIFDLNTRYAINYVLDNHLIEQKINLLKGHIEEKIDLEKIKEELILKLKNKSGING